MKEHVETCLQQIPLSVPESPFSRQQCSLRRPLRIVTSLWRCPRAGSIQVLLWLVACQVGAELDLAMTSTVGTSEICRPQSCLSIPTPTPRLNYHLSELPPPTMTFGFNVPKVFPKDSFTDVRTYLKIRESYVMPNRVYLYNTGLCTSTTFIFKNVPR